MKTYTFHVSLPGFGRLWRKIEMPADSTLEDLHLAIQDAYDFDDDHLYSFFMSGRAWDSNTEYCLPEGATPWGFFDEGEDEDVEVEEDEEAEQDVTPDENAASLSGPTSDEILHAIAAARENPALRAELTETMVKEYGVPAALVDLVIDHAETFLQGEVTGPLADLFEEELGFDGEPGDVREITLDSLDLKVGQQFMYLFDYGDEWRFKVRVHALNENADPSLEYPRLVESVGTAPEQYPGLDEEDDFEDEEEMESGSPV